MPIPFFVAGLAAQAGAAIGIGVAGVAAVAGAGAVVDAVKDSGKKELSEADLKIIASRTEQMNITLSEMKQLLKEENLSTDILDEKVEVYEKEISAYEAKISSDKKSLKKKNMHSDSMQEQEALLEEMENKLILLKLELRELIEQEQKQTISNQYIEKISNAIKEIEADIKELEQYVQADMSANDFSALVKGRFDSGTQKITDKIQNLKNEIANMPIETENTETKNENSYMNFTNDALKQAEGTYIYTCKDFEKRLVGQINNMQVLYNEICFQKNKDFSEKVKEYAELYSYNKQHLEQGKQLKKALMKKSLYLDCIWQGINFNKYSQMLKQQKELLEKIGKQTGTRYVKDEKPVADTKSELYQKLGLNIKVLELENALKEKKEIYSDFVKEADIIYQQNKLANQYRSGFIRELNIIENRFDEIHNKLAQNNDWHEKDEDIIENIKTAVQSLRDLKENIAEDEVTTPQIDMENKIFNVDKKAVTEFKEQQKTEFEKNYTALEQKLKDIRKKYQIAKKSFDYKPSDEKITVYLEYNYDLDQTVLEKNEYGDIVEFDDDDLEDILHMTKDEWFRRKGNWHGLVKALEEDINEPYLLLFYGLEEDFETVKQAFADDEICECKWLKQ